MLDFIEEIKVACQNPNVSVDSLIPDWLRRCRQRNIPSIAVETLVNFYKFPSDVQKHTGDDPFIEVSNPFLDLRLVEENRKLRDRISKLEAMLDTKRDN